MTRIGSELEETELLRVFECSVYRDSLRRVYVREKSRQVWARDELKLQCHATSLGTEHVPLLSAA